MQTHLKIFVNTVSVPTDIPFLPPVFPELGCLTYEGRGHSIQGYKALISDASMYFAKSRSQAYQAVYMGVNTKIN